MASKIRRTTSKLHSRRQPRAYRPSSEAALVRRLARDLPAFFSAVEYQWGIKREVTVGSSIADLVLLVDRAAKPMSLGRAFSVRESVVLAGVLRGRLREGSRPEAGPQLDATLESLVGLGVLVERNGDLAVSRDWQRAKRVVAIEAKLIKWREALNQAIHYRQYADEAYVALPELLAAPALASLEKFRIAGVGLLTVSELGIKKRVPAVRSNRHDWKREFILSRLIQHLA